MQSANLHYSVNSHACSIFLDVLHKIGKIQNNLLIEVQKGDLVGNNTIAKTRQVSANAKGGVLLVDRADRLLGLSQRQIVTPMTQCMSL